MTSKMIELISITICGTSGLGREKRDRSWRVGLGPAVDQSTEGVHVARTRDEH